MTNSMQHHHVTFLIQEDKVNEIQNLIEQCEKQVSLKKNENGPTSWCVSFDEDKKRLFVDALFPNQEAFEFHRNNIQSYIEKLMELTIEPPQRTVGSVFSALSTKQHSPV